jgi:S-adenosylmethionine:tRNA ribosyltransferase-isomerase
MNQLSKKDFNYDLPEELIAHHPCAERDGCRLLYLEQAEKLPQHLAFRDLIQLIPSQTLMIFNDTRVVPARVPFIRQSGGHGEMLIQYDMGHGRLRAIGRPSKRLKLAEQVKCLHRPELSMELLAYHGDGQWDIRFLPDNPWPDRMEGLGEIPLPPYIDRKEGPSAQDYEQYQTVFSREPGSAAAPTASLHFTDDLLAQLKAKGIEQHYITHHVGSGTFLPMRADDLSQYVMHLEVSSVSETCAKAIAKAKAEGRPICAVGTTVVRALESGAQQILMGQAYSGSTQLFIHPPYTFKLVDELITNFHLPESTLLMLVSALVGRERILEAYSLAVAEKYRFFSYGDAMYLKGQALKI